MTAEIAIMNREAIALASDSAVTSVTGSGHKIFTSANKLFALSQHHPVSVMVYGKASFMDAPWELIIKTYRKHLGERQFATIEEYIRDLISFLSNKNPLFPEDLQNKYYLQRPGYPSRNFHDRDILPIAHSLFSRFS